MTDETQKTLNDIYDGLKADFPKEAYSTDSSRGFDLTSVKAQYVIERLNDVLTIAGWELQGGFDFESAKESGVVYNGYLQVNFAHCGGPDVNQKIHAIGFAKKEKNIGDTLKKARTDALSKAASYLGVANEVFKGNVAPPSKSGSPAKKVAKKAPTKKTTTKPASFQGKKPNKPADF